MKRTPSRYLAAALVAVAAWTTNGEPDPASPSFLIASAEARLGRPVTPVSYAGVARRTTRRAVATDASVVSPTNPDGIGGPASGVGVLPGAGGGQAGVGYSRGAGANLGGPVNRVGVR